MRFLDGESPLHFDAGRPLIRGE